MTNIESLFTQLPSLTLTIYKVVVSGLISVFKLKVSKTPIVGTQLSSKPLV